MVYYNILVFILSKNRVLVTWSLTLSNFFSYVSVHGVCFLLPILLCVVVSVTRSVLCPLMMQLIKVRKSFSYRKLPWMWCTYHPTTSVGLSIFIQEVFVRTYVPFNNQCGAFHFVLERTQYTYVRMYHSITSVGFSIFVLEIFVFATLVWKSFMFSCNCLWTRHTYHRLATVGLVHACPN